MPMLLWLYAYALWLRAYAFVALCLHFRDLIPILSWLYAYALVASRLRSCGFMPMQRDLTHADCA
jgi:hypothetical protein